MMLSSQLGNEVWRKVFSHMVFVFDERDYYTVGEKVSNQVESIIWDQVEVKIFEQFVDDADKLRN